MADPNTAVFDFANTVINQEVVKKASQNADNLRRRIAREASRFVEDFYREMLYGPEGLQKYSKVYDKIAPLSTETIYRKGHGRYYEQSGDLIDELLSRDPLADLGKPQVRFEGGQRTEGAAVFIDRAGRAQYAAGSGKRGFAPGSALRNLAFSIVINIFPQVRGQDYDKAILRMTSGFNTLKLSYGEFGTKRQPARPLVRPFLQWYSTTGLRRMLVEKFSIQV